MAASRYLEQILFKEQSPAADQLFEDRSENLFETGDNSFVELHVQRPWRRDRKGKIDNGNLRYGYYEALSDLEFVQNHPSEPRSSEPPYPVDKSNFLSQEPPPYVEAPGLQLKRVSDVEELSKVASESNSCNRLCFIRQRHSYSRLQINRKLFETLLSKFGMFPRFKEFALLFGWKHEETEVGHPQLRFRMLTSHASAGSNRAIAGFECAYALRYVELNNRSIRNPWSLRQTAVYHRYSVKDDVSTWVIISASQKAETCLDRYVKSLETFGAHNPFDIHVLLVETALANWRPYIISLTQNITKQSDRVLVASIDGKEALHSIDINERQMLKDVEDELLDIILVFDSLHVTLTNLLRNYSRYRVASHASDTDNRDDFDCISEALKEKSEDVLLHRRKIQTLHKKLKGTISLLSNILDLGNGFSLRQLAEEARNENITMRRLAEKTTQDAAAVKVLTIITLVYLPATVVSNFFSSQFVSTREQENVLTVVLNSNAWLFAAISVPLTLITIVVWWIWITFQANMAERKTRPLVSPLNTIWTDKPKTGACGDGVE